MKPYSMVIGRFQPWHKGHFWMIREILDEDPENRVWIAVREVELSDKNPYYPADVVQNIKRELRKRLPFHEQHRIHVSIIPDIEGVHYGRGVGWRIVEHVPSDDIAEISATKIREGK